MAVSSFQTTLQRRCIKVFVSRMKTAFLILIAFIFFFALLWNHPEVAQADDEPAPDNNEEGEVDYSWR